MKLPEEFYTREDVVLIARELLGKYLLTSVNGKITGGIITETEAYAGAEDKASHAYGNRKTDRTEVMFAKGGISYVYLCYGIHYLFNVVTSVADIPHAVLIRAIEPIDGEEEMMKRTKKKKLKAIADGPGKLTKALGIDIKLNRVSLKSDQVWIEDRGFRVSDENILVSKRIGIDFAEEDTDLLYRFNLKQ